jgi:hypothetical protein
LLSLKLLLVSSNRETLDGVQEYFKRVGARLSSARQLDEVGDKASGVDVVVMFADDFSHDKVRETVARLKTRLVIIVTAEDRAFTPSRKPKPGEQRILVLARPAWGWMLLDAVRLALPPRNEDD